MTTYLTTLSEINDVQPISVNLDPDRVNAFILQAQVYGLQNVVGPALYTRIVTEVGSGTVSAAIVALEPLYKPYLAHQVVSAMYRTHGVEITRYGVNQKVTPITENATLNERMRLANEIGGYSVTDATMLLDYICNNRADYPEYVADPNGRPVGQVGTPRIVSSMMRPNIYR